MTIKKEKENIPNVKGQKLGLIHTKYAKNMPK